MASLGSLSFFLETPREGLFFQGNSGWRRRGGKSSASPISACRGRRGRHQGLSRVWGLEEMGKVGSFLSFSPSGGGRPAIYAEASKGKSEVTEWEEGSSVHDEESVGDENLKATIRKGRKALARQKELLQQIVEKRKLVSSFKNSVTNTEIDVVTSNGINSIPDMDLSLSNGSTRGKLLDAINPIVPSQTTKTKMPKISSGGDLDIENKVIDTSQVENSIENILVMSKETDSAATVMPSMLPRAAEPYAIEEEKLGKITEAYLEDTSLIKDTDSEEEKTIPVPLAGANVMNVIVVSAECAPWSKTGGLGDVAGSLPKALAKRGHRVMVVTPRYGCYSDLEDIGLRKIYKIDGQDMEVTYHHAFIDGVDFVFIESAMFRNRDRDIYGGQRMDILKRMVLLCKVAVEVPWHVPCGGSIYGDGNLVFIANDWHTALLPVYLRTYYRDNGLMKFARSVLVIHNIAHQGRGPVDDFRYLDLPGHCIDLFKMYDPVGGDHLNVFRAGLQTADRVVTVSRGYAWELKTIEGGWGLHEVIKENDWKFQGIVNGIDTTDWNPAVDIHLKHDGYINYSLDTYKAGKAQCKAALQRELHFPVRDDVPLLGFIGRLDGQKGVDIIADAIPWMASQDMQLVLLGTGRNDLEDMLRRFEGLYHDKVIGRVGFSVSLAHRITAGCDILLMPSRFEPCGLNQLYAMMYGTVPVVHSVGGLRDTVVPFDPFTESGLGWTFDRAEPNKLIDALRNCFETYRNYKSSWEGLQRRGMAQDLSWDNAAQHYEEVLVAAKYQW